MDEQRINSYIEDIISGNQDSYRYLIEEFKDAVYNLVLKFCGNFSDAEDITSEAFVKAYKNIKSFKADHGSFRNWLYSIAVNLARDLLRRRRFRAGSIDITILLEESDLPAQFPDEIDNPEKNIFSKEEGREILITIHSLPVKYRTVIILRYMENMSYEEIAKLLKKPLGTIKTYIFRAQKILMKKIEHVD